MAQDSTEIPYGKIVDVGQLGAAIRHKRRAIGMRQAELAAMSGVGARFLSELENGKPTAEIGKALRVLKRLGLDVRIEPRSAGPTSEQR
jgi:HTH-type transcriptional regulator/antitoxin HipB